jgi:2-methylcitrate dehydratase PrpD
MTLTGRTAPKNGLESKLSFTHACAVPFTARQAGVHQFTDACAADAQVAQLRTRVSSIVDPTIGTDQARIRVRLDGGTSGERVVERWIEHSIGSFDNPMSDAALDAKFISLATEVLTPGRARALLDACHGIQAIGDARELVALARPMP